MGFTTDILNTSFSKPDAHAATHMPVYSNAAFTFESAEAMEAAFQGRTPDHMYSRISNPTVEHLEQRIRSITGSQSVTALSSGMAAISNVLLTIAQQGDNIIISRNLFGNTFSFFNSTLRAFGVTPRFTDLTKPAEILGNIDDRTIALFFETITNPQMEVADIQTLATISKDKNLLLIADSTLTPPNIFSAGKSGIHLEVVSSTKIISGGATSVGGLIIDYGTYNWKNNAKLADLAKRFGPFAFNYKLRKEILRNIGACLSPFHAYLQSLGLETLDLRFGKAAANTSELAHFLESHTEVVKVNYPGLVSSPFNQISEKQFGKYPGTIFTFELVSRDACYQFLNNLKLIRRATNLSDNRSLIIHPASTIYGDYSPEDRKLMGVSDTLIRLSVGIEDVDDLKNDLNAALLLKCHPSFDSAQHD